MIKNADGLKEPSNKHHGLPNEGSKNASTHDMKRDNKIACASDQTMSGTHENDQYQHLAIALT